MDLDNLEDTRKSTLIDEAPLVRLERTTYGLEVRRSVH